MYDIFKKQLRSVILEPKLLIFMMENWIDTSTQKYATM